MEDNYVLAVKSRFGRIELKGEKCHDVKAIAGALFHQPSVESVYVGDKLGNHYLYLVKDHPEKRENVPAKEALFG